MHFSVLHLTFQTSQLNNLTLLSKTHNLSKEIKTYFDPIANFICECDFSPSSKSEKFFSSSFFPAFFAQKNLRDGLILCVITCLLNRLIPFHFDYND